MKVGNLLKKKKKGRRKDSLSLDMALILKNSTVRGAWQTTVHGIRKIRTWLSSNNFTFTSLDMFPSSSVSLPLIIYILMFNIVYPHLQLFRRMCVLVIWA